jgi:hypothetical protein
MSDDEALIARIIQGAIGNVSDEHAFKAVLALKKCGKIIVDEHAYDQLVEDCKYYKRRRSGDY